MIKFDYEENEKEQTIANYLYALMFVIFFVFIIGIIIGIIFIKNEPTNSYNNTIVDSIKQENNKLILKVEHLDSIKNAEIIEVKTLDNDSTVKLFYKLIRE